MATLEERIAFLEGRVDEHSQMLTGIREAIVNLEQRMDRRFETIELRLTALDQKLDHGVAALDQKLDQRIVALDQKLDQRVAALDQKLDQRFAWLLGVQITTLIAIVAALLAR